MLFTQSLSSSFIPSTYFSLRIKTKTDLHLIMDATNNEAANGNPPTMEGHDRLVEMAKLKTNVMIRRPRNGLQFLNNKIDDYSWRFEACTLARDTREGALGRLNERWTWR